MIFDATRPGYLKFPSLRPWSRLLTLSLLVLPFLALVVSGCAGIDFHDPLNLVPDTVSSGSPEAKKQRREFQLDRTPAAFTWLMANLVENGMTVSEVSEALGETGERYFEDREMKTHGGQYQDTDVGYKWGPDTNGRSVVLFFRDDKLVNFDPDDFRTGQQSTRSFLKTATGY